MDVGRLVGQNREQRPVPPVKMHGFQQSDGAMLVNNGLNGLNHLGSIRFADSKTRAEKDGDNPKAMRDVRPSASGEFLGKPRTGKRQRAAAVHGGT